MRNSIATRLIVVLTLCSALIMSASMLFDYQFSREEILERVRLEAQETVGTVIVDLENLLEGVEGSTLFLGKILEQREYTRDGLVQMLKDIVENNDDIYGSSIALNPEFLDEPLGFAPYYFYQEGFLTFANLAKAENNYQQQPWFIDTVRVGRPLWIEPYFDEGGGEVAMTTFSVPVFRLDPQGQRFLYAVVTADVALKTLDSYLQRLRLGQNGFALLLSKDGTVMSNRNAASVMKHYLDSASSPGDRIIWQELFEQATARNNPTRELECEGIDGNCTIRMAVLETTGWPVGVLFSQREVLQPLQDYQVKTALLALLSLLVMALAVFLVTRRITQPLSALAHAADGFARGELGSPLPRARGDDEVARLIRSFKSMEQDLKGYIANLEEVTASRSRLEGELAAATEIQMSMLPQGGEATEDTQQFNLWAKVRPAKTVGGDLYTYARAGDMLYICVGDVSDKGVPAALFMAKAISLIQQLQSEFAQPAQGMALLNNALEAGNDNCMFVTLFFGVLDLRDYSLRFVSAGHTAPSLYRNGAVEVVLQEYGAALGLMAGLVYEENVLQLSPGDRLAIYTDGIDEAFNTDAQMFGTERFNECLSNSASSSPAAAGTSIFTHIDEFAGEAPQSDDITLLILDIPISAAAVQSSEHNQNFPLDEQLHSSVCRWLEHLLEQAGTQPDVIMELTLVLEELVTNVRKYSGMTERDLVEVKLSMSSAAIGLQICDLGKPFNPLLEGHRSTLGADIEAAEVGGLGVHLITQLTDEQTYRREANKNILRVIKWLPEGSS
ncbi:MAG: SpoIIE family protein phosphatase [Halioglobus sp.]